MRSLLDSSNKIVAKSRDTAKEQNMFTSSSKNKVLIKEAGIAYLYKFGEHGWNGCLVVQGLLYCQTGTINEE